ncbi:hypothetical protein PGO_093910 [Plasmodium gonderi]|uniref:Uncharacterized protein n=1 Tax=Plasmodium gonderi TaxID=77519 RepID=A0A1Y1JF79_PLAGO|nr:hypothetical protein PGO_093910 [Plasmodium gonderi]GAW81191.1 hypothetical protein PGO_093910 [Plasmodium gonderi]
MDNNAKEMNSIIDKNRTENVNKYIYSKFPTFDTHKKIKHYNNKISELILENDKLKKYKKNLEKRIIEENKTFDVNFNKYELAISNALRLGSACIYLCITLNKIISKNKILVLRELLRKRDEYKNSLIKSYIGKNTFNKMFINSMIKKIESVYEKNKHFVTIILVILIKSKLRYSLKSFIRNVLDIPSRYKNMSSNLEFKRYCSNQLGSTSMKLNTKDRIKYTFGFIKLIDVLKNRIYATVRISFLYLKYINNDTYNIYGWGVNRSTNNNPSSKKENMQLVQNDSEMEVNMKEKLNGYRFEGITGNHVNETGTRCTKKYNCKDTRYNEEEEGELEKDINFKEYDSNFKLLKQNDMVGDKQKIIQSNVHTQDEYINLENDGSSLSSYLPRPRDVYNYLYYQELLKIKEKFPEKFLHSRNDDFKNYANYANNMESSGEICYLRKNDKERNASIRNLLSYKLDYGEGNTTSEGNDQMRGNNLIPINKYTWKRGNKIDCRFTEEFSNAANDLNFSIYKGGLSDGKFDHVLLSHEEVGRDVKIAKTIEELFEKKKKLRLNLKNDLTCKYSENKHNYGSNMEKLNIVNGSSAYNSNSQLIKDVKDCSTSFNAFMCEDNLREKKNNPFYRNQNVEEAREEIQYYQEGDCEKLQDDLYEIENYTGSENIKTMLSLSNIKNEFKTMFSQFNEPNMEKYNESIHVENQNMCDQKIEQIKHGLSRITHKNFLCLVGQGPPDDLGVYSKDKHSFGEDDRVMSMMDVKNTWGNKESPKIICTIRK